MNNNDLPYKIERRIEELDFTLEYSYSKIFEIICNEFGLDTMLYAKLLGCQCPFGLIGLLEELTNYDSPNLA